MHFQITPEWFLSIALNMIHLKLFLNYHFNKYFLRLYFNINSSVKYYNTINLFHNVFTKYFRKSGLKRSRRYELPSKVQYKANYTIFVHILCYSLYLNKKWLYIGFILAKSNKIFY